MNELDRNPLLSRRTALTAFVVCYSGAVALARDTPRIADKGSDTILFPPRPAVQQDFAHETNMALAPLLVALNTAA